jgi:hypothetical protein
VHAKAQDHHEGIASVLFVDLRGFVIIRQPDATAA